MMHCCLLTAKKIIFLIAILFATSANDNYAQNTWTQKADVGGTTRAAAVAFSIGSKGYIGTGISTNNVSTKDFWEYDPANNAWTQKADFGGTARFYAAGFSIGGKGYLGTGVSQGGFTKDFWEYDPAANTWSRKADFGGTTRPEAVGFSIGSKGYIGTGWDGLNTKKDFWEYDPGTNTWTRKADFGGTARLEAFGFSISGKGYIGTGGDATNNNFYKDFWEYDPGTNTWNRKADFGGTARFGAVGFSIGSKGYLGAGYDGNFHKDFWEYDPGTNTWTKKADFGGTTRYDAVGFSIGGKGYMGTGNISSSVHYKDFWEYTPDCYQNMTVYADADGDGYGNANKSKINPTCDLLASYVLDSADCNDADAKINPGAGEIPNDNIDNNCNGVVDEKLNNALDFDGVDDRVAIGDLHPISTGVAGEYTFEAWIKINAYGQDVYIYGDERNHNSGIMVELNSGGYIQTFHPSLNYVISTAQVPLNTWTHVAFSQNNTNLKLYVNGVFIQNMLSKPYLHIETNEPAYFGAFTTDHISFSRYFAGKIDEARVWNYARSEAEIQADMIGGSCGDQNGLVAAYSFNQGIAGGNNTGVTTLNDITSNHNNGTLINFALTGVKSNWVAGVSGLSDSTIVFKDADNDKYGNAAASMKVPVCAIPSGYVLDGTDCNDADASIHPNTTEICNGIDDNCNGLVDEISGLTTTNITAKTATFNWNKLPDSRFYIIKYRRLDSAVTTWSKVGVTAPAIAISISGLRPNSKYVWKIRGHCNGQYTAFSGPVRFTTAAALTAGQQNNASVTATVKGLSVYPNPTLGNVTINLTLSKQQSVSIRVLDIVGKEVYASNEGIRSGTFTKQLALDKLNPGVYFLKVKHNGETEMWKIVLTK